MEKTRVHAMRECIKGKMLREIIMLLSFEVKNGAKSINRTQAFFMLQSYFDCCAWKFHVEAFSGNQSYSCNFDRLD